MTHILDNFAAPLPFRPSTPQEFFALRLAQKLGDTAHLQRYLSFVSAHGLELLLAAYRHATSGKNGDLAHRFSAALAALTQRRNDADQ